MAAGKQPDPGRRRFLRRIVGGELRERVQRVGLVDDYRSFLQRVGDDLAFGGPESELPAPKAEIAEAIRTAVRRDDMELPLPALRHAYASLAMFCDDETLALVRFGEQGLLAARPMEEDEKRRIQSAFAIRNQLVQSRAALEREFDELVRELVAARERERERAEAAAEDDE